ncbi:MAG: hypothetical protein ABJD57_10195, partial [Roseibium sp.]
MDTSNGLQLAFWRKFSCDTAASHKGVDEQGQGESRQKKDQHLNVHSLKDQFERVFQSLGDDLPDNWKRARR